MAKTDTKTDQAAETQPAPEATAPITDQTSTELTHEEQLAWNRCVGLQAKIDELELGLGQRNESYESAAEIIAKMHAAAVGEVRGPIRGVVEDIEDLRAERDALAAQAAAFQASESERQTSESERQESLNEEFGAPPTAETLKLAAKLLEDSIFHSGNLSTNEAAALRPLVDALRAAGQTPPPPPPTQEDTPGEIPVNHFGEDNDEGDDAGTDESDTGAGA